MLAKVTKAEMSSRYQNNQSFGTDVLVYLHNVLSLVLQNLWRSLLSRIRTTFTRMTDGRDSMRFRATLLTLLAPRMRRVSFPRWRVII